MDSQIYLLLTRSTGDYTDYEDEFKDLNEITAPILAAGLLSDMVMGDSLDVPFLQFIRVASLKHELKFDDSSTFDDSKGALASGWGMDLETKATAAKYSPNPHLRTMGSTSTTATRSYKPERARRDFNARRSRGTLHPTKGKNQFVQSAIPEHGDLTFTKYIDSATPQLAYGCAAQEKFPLALFIYRRRMGLGIGGVRFPYYMVGGFKCKIKNWSIENDMETVSLHYRKIAWCGFLQWADTNLSLPWSNRWFDQEEYKGGQGGAATGIQLIVGGIVALAGAGFAAAEAALSSDDGSSSDLD